MDNSLSTARDLLHRWDRPVPLSSVLPEPSGSRAFSVLGGVPSLELASPPVALLPRPTSRDGEASRATEETAALADTQEEALVADSRASLTPAQMVERKLVSLLKSNPLPVSHLKTGARSLRSR